VHLQMSFVVFTVLVRVSRFQEISSVQIGVSVRIRVALGMTIHILPSIHLIWGIGRL